MPVLPTYDNASNAVDLPTGLHKTMSRKDFKTMVTNFDADHVYVGEILLPPGFPLPQIDIYSETWVSGGAGSVELTLSPCVALEWPAPNPSKVNLSAANCLLSNMASE